MCGILATTDVTTNKELFKQALSTLIDRGPDEGCILSIKDGMMGFRRLAIMGLTEEGMQPFTLDNSALICNGEIYCFRPLKEKLK